MSIIDNDGAAHTISCCPIDKAEYDKMAKETDDSIFSGQYTTIEDLEKETKKF